MKKSEKKSKIAKIKNKNIIPPPPAPTTTEV
jgi:hypothetical protein